MFSLDPFYFFNQIWSGVLKLNGGQEISLHQQTMVSKQVQIFLVFWKLSCPELADITLYSFIHSLLFLWSLLEYAQDYTEGVWIFVMTRLISFYMYSYLEFLILWVNQENDGRIDSDLLITDSIYFCTTYSKLLNKSSTAKYLLMISAPLKNRWFLQVLFLWLIHLMIVFKILLKWNLWNLELLCHISFIMDVGDNVMVWL